MSKHKKTAKKELPKKGLKHHYHRIKQKLTPLRIIILIGLLLLPIGTVVLLATSFQPQNTFAKNKSNQVSQDISPIRKPDNAVVDRFNLTETSFVNDFSLKINDFKIVKTESDKYPDYCIFSLEMFNFGSQSLLSSEQFKLTQAGNNLELSETLLPSNPLKLNYSVDLESSKAVNFEIYFGCSGVTSDNLIFEFTPFRVENIASTKAEFPVFDSKKNQYFASLKYEFPLNDSFNLNVSGNLPLEINPLKFELTTINKISVCILRLELKNIGYSPWLFDEIDLNLETAAGQKLNRLVVDKNSGGVFRKIPLEAMQTREADYAFNCSTPGDYVLKYNPQYISADFVENKSLELALKL